MTGILKDKVAVVTGAARGIGRATAIALAREGAHIAGVDVCAPVFVSSGVAASTKEDLKETGRLVKAEGSKWHEYVFDQRDIAAVKSAAQRIEKECGGIDILFANAGVQGFQSILEMDDENWHTQIDVNLTGTANVLRAFAPYMVKKKKGRIIITASTQGRHGTKLGAAYSASKWGLLGLMKSAALELGQYGITVNAMVPGLIDTPLTRHQERYAQVLEISGKKVTDTKQDEQDAKKILSGKSPLGVPWIEPDDVAPVVVFLASDAAKMVSGAAYEVTAGDSANF